METVAVVVVVEEATIEDAVEEGSLGSKGEDEEGMASYHTRVAEAGDLDKDSMDALQQALAAAVVVVEVVLAIVELYSVASVGK